MIELGADLSSPLTPKTPPAWQAPVTIAVIDGTSRLFTPLQLRNIVWSLRYQALFHYNWSPWVLRGLAAPIQDVVLVPAGSLVPAGAWPLELLDTSDQAGALGYHEDVSVVSKAGPAGAHAIRGLLAGGEMPLSKVFCKTSQEDHVQPSEVASHELMEMIVNPWVTDERRMRKYLDSGSHRWFIGEVGDPVQDEGYDVGSLEGKPCKVPEAVVANFAWPAWWGQPQGRKQLDMLGSRKTPFELAPGGYMSVAPEAAPSNWSQIYGQDRPRAQANEHAFEKAGDET